MNLLPNEIINIIDKYSLELLVLDKMKFNNSIKDIGISKYIDNDNPTSVILTYFCDDFKKNKCIHFYSDRVPIGIRCKFCNKIMLSGLIKYGNYCSYEAECLKNFKVKN